MENIITAQTSTTLVGDNSSFETYLQNGEIEKAKEMMTCNAERITEARTEYSQFSHDIMRKPDHLKLNPDGSVKELKKTWKIPISFQQYINEISLVFLYGRPVKWLQNSENTDEVFTDFLDIIKRTRFNSKIRQCKRLAGSETECAMLFRPYRNKEGKADLQIRVLAQSKGDTIYSRFDEYENLLAIGWEYYLKDNEETTRHFNLYTADKIYYCKSTQSGWEVKQESNIIGKIPIILFRQNKEWSGAEYLLNRLEHIISRTADTNDYFADPIAVVSADIVVNNMLPDKDDSGKLMISRNSDNVNNAAKYLTWDNAPESKKDEIEWLEEKIHLLTFTPKISLETLKSISQLSAKALKTVMLLADIKASKHKEVHDELLDRVANLIKSIMANVLLIPKRSQIEQLDISHEYQEPFGEDIADAITNITKMYDSELLSQETAVELNPLVKNPQKEIDRLEKAKEEKTKNNPLFQSTAQDINPSGNQGLTDDEDDE